MFATTLDGALAPMVSPGYVLLSKQFGISVDEVASSFGSILLGLGCFMQAFGISLNDNNLTDNIG